MKAYLPRIADKLLEERLYAKGAVLIEGPKWCGKTTTAKQKAKSFILWIVLICQNNISRWQSFLPILYLREKHQD